MSEDENILKFGELPEDPEISKILETSEVSEEPIVEDTAIVEDKVSEEPEVVPEVVPEIVPEVTSVSGQSVLLVKGLSSGMNDEVSGALEKMGVSFVVFDETSEDGKQLIAGVGGYSGVSFALIVLSDDEVAAEKTIFPKNATFRALQSNIFTFGFLLSKLGADKVFALTSSVRNFESPSLNQHILYTKHDDSGRWQFDLLRELKKNGFDVDANKLL